MICGACGRILRDPNSKEAGYGPVCYKKIFGVPPPKGKKEERKEGRKDYRDDLIPGQMELSDFMCIK